MKYPEHLDPMLAAEDGSKQLARFAIDQLIVDGIVCSAQNRTPRLHLYQAAFHLVDVEDAVVQSFDKAFDCDWRSRQSSRTYVRMVPHVSDDTIARPRPEAILSRTARTSSEEYRDILERMKSYAPAVLDSEVAGEVSPSLLETGAVIEAAGFDVDFPEVAGFVKFMYMDPRFAAHSEEVRRPSGTADRPAQPIDALGQSINAALGFSRKYKSKRRF